MRIDAHQHFWKWSKGWFSRPEPVLSCDYMPEEFERILKVHTIDKTIVVQTSPATAETDFLLKLAENSRFIGGVVGWLNLESPDFPCALERYSRKQHFVAVRPMIESMIEDDWILKPRVIESLSLIAQAGVAFEFLTSTRHLPYVLRVLERIPQLKAVIDHLSKPEIRIGRMQPWQDLIRAVAEQPNVYCKLSGMATEADPANWNREQLRPYAEHVLERFGADRVIFGSDWPVCLLAASYKEVIETAHYFVKRALGDTALTAVFGSNAERFYRLGARP